MMATFHVANSDAVGEDGDSYRVAVKGAPESILEFCSRILTAEGEREMNDDKLKQWLEQKNKMAEAADVYPKTSP